MMNVELHEVEINWMTIKNTKQRTPENAKNKKNKWADMKYGFKLKTIYI